MGEDTYYEKEDCFFMKKRKLLMAGMVIAACLTMAGCGKENTVETNAGSSGSEAQQPERETTGENIVLTIATSDATQQSLFESLELAKKFSELYPNVTVEIEKFQESGEFENAMKIRAASNSLPDIMFFKPTALSKFGEHLAELDDLEAVSSNLYAAEYAIDGSIKGIPETSSREFVFYWKSIFEECGVEVPDTWEELIQVSTVIKEKMPDVAPIAMGGKDEWPDYPFNEYMPSLEAKDGQYWNIMAQQDTPFEAGSPINIAYHKIQKLYDAQVFGPDPQGIGFDQARAMFSSQQAGMILAGSWVYKDIADAAPDKLDDLGTFYLPTRDTKSDEFVTISQADGFLTISKTSKNIDMAKKFAEFYYGEEWYPDYIQEMGYLPTVKDVEVQLEAAMMEAVDRQKDVTIILYDGGGTEFNRIVSEVKFDYKKLGTEMMTPGFDLEKRFETLNELWKDAR